MFVRYCNTFCLLLAVFCVACSSNDHDITNLSSPSSNNTEPAFLVDKATSFKQTNFDSVHHYALLAIQLAKENNDDYQLAKALALEGSYQRRTGNYPAAITHCQEAQQLFRQMGQMEDAIQTRLVISDIYKEMGGERGTIDYLEKGLEYAKESYREASALKFGSGMVMGLNMQGIIFRDLYKATGKGFYMDSAHHCYTEALNIVSNNGGGEEYLGKLYNNASQVYNEYYNDYDKALALLQQAEAYNLDRNNQNSLSFNYGNISDVYLKLGQKDKAAEYAHGMLRITNELKAPHRILNAYNQLIRVHKDQQRFDSALYYKELYTSLTDSITNVEKASAVVAIDTRYETKEKDSQIGYLSQLNQVSGKRLWVAVIAGMILALFLGIMVYQNRRLKKKKEQIDQQSQHLKWLMKELHHRVKNNLQVVSSLLSLQVNRTKDQDSVVALKESQLRVQAMSLIHQRLYQVDDITLVNFRFYLSDLAESLMRAYGFDRDAFDLDITVEDEYLDVDTVMPLGLLVNELLTNSFKYAYNGIEHPLLHIRMQKNGDQLKLEIRDNGPGTLHETDSQGFGTRLVKALSKQLKADYVVENNNGMIYRFNIPYTKTKAA